MVLREKTSRLCDRATAVLLALVVLGSTLAFGGAVWWFPPVLLTVVFLLVATNLIQQLATGRMPILKSPLTPLGLLALGLGLIQLVPLPTAFASRLSPVAHQAYCHGLLPELARMDDPEVRLSEPSEIRSPATLDRPATLRWLLGAAACLAIFWTVSHYADRLVRLYLVWGLVIAGFLLNTALAIVQVTNRTDGLYGLYVPGNGPNWTPSFNDLLEAPGTALLRNLPHTATTALAQPPTSVRVVLLPTMPFLFGTMVASSGAYLAMGALAMPLGLAVILHLLSSRRGREGLTSHLAHSGQGSLVTLIAALSLAGAFLTGLVAGFWYCLPLVVGLMIVALPSLSQHHQRWVTLSTVTLLLAGLSLGIAFRDYWPALIGGQPPTDQPDLQLAQSLWSSALEVLRRFPLVGAGLGSFATVYPYFKNTDLSSATAMSSFLQWGAEAGAVGLGMMLLGILWCIFKLPSSLRRVGSIDRILARGLIGAAVSITLLALVHWTVELSAVAISASALGGTWNRWLAGGTDLFVERG
jgi:hypothetical protein